MPKIIPFPGKRRDNLVKPLVDRPERFSSGELHRGRREEHTQEKYVPEAMNLTLVTTSRWTEPTRRPQRKAGGRERRRSPSTLRLNNSNVKRKPSARGRTR